MKSKMKFKERADIECFGANGFLKWAELGGKDIPITREDITACEWKKIKNNTVNQRNLSHNL